MLKFFRKIRQNLLTEGKTTKYITYAIGEIVLVVIGILIALSINNWNEGRAYEKKVQGKLNLVHRELIDDISALEKEIEIVDEKYHLIHRSLHMIEQETSLSNGFRQLLDSAFIRHKRIDPLFNNTRSYEDFLSTESDFIDAEIYSDLNEYLDLFEETNARVKRFSETINQAEYDIDFLPSIVRRNSGEYIYSLTDIKGDKNLFEVLRMSKSYFETISDHYGEVLKLARELEGKINNI